MKRPAVLWALSGFFAVAAAAASVRLVTLSGELADLEAERDRLEVGGSSRRLDFRTASCFGG